MYYYPHDKLASKHSQLKQQIFIISHCFWGSGIWEWLSQMILAQGFSWDSNQVFIWICSHFKTQVGLEDPLPNSLMWLFAGFRPLLISLAVAASIPHSNWSKRRVIEVPFITSYHPAMPSLLLYSADHTD